MTKRQKDRQHNDQKKKEKNTTQKTKDRATRTPLNPGVNSGTSEG